MHIKHPPMLTISMLIMLGSFLMSLSRLVAHGATATAEPEAFFYRARLLAGCADPSFKIGPGNGEKPHSCSVVL